MKIPPFQSPEGWAKKEKRSFLVKGEGENKRTVGIKIVAAKETFVIPVIDVRHEKGNRGLIKLIEKQVSQSKFMKPSFSVLGHSYNVSRKNL